MFVENVTDIDDKIILRAHVTRAEQLVQAVRPAAATQGLF
jgi:cysteinyl-tRNA synthetase